jgi:hypothetical protein
MLTIISPENVLNSMGSLGDDLLVIPILSDQDRHYTQNRISSIYIHDLETEIEYLIGFHSVDMVSVSPDVVYDILRDKNLFLYNRRYFTPVGLAGMDVDLYTWYHTNSPIEILRNNTSIFSIYRRMYSDIINTNDVIPIMRLLYYFRDIRDQFISYTWGRDIPKGLIFYNNVYLESLIRIETSGIGVDQTKFQEKYNRETSPIIYTEYRPYTMTGRPNSKFDRINFNSLSKSDGSREMIVSRFEDGRLIEFDYDSYHVRLIAGIIGYDLPDGNIHTYFAEQYFDTKYVTDEMYEKSKRITFRQLYGDFDSDYQHIEFFKKTADYVDGVWDTYVANGYFESPISKRKFLAEWFTDMNKSKIFNYIIQAYESELNAMVLEKILEYLYTRNSKIIMYTYDAVLLDYDRKDGTTMVSDIAEIMQMFGHPVRLKVGINYNDLIEAEIIQ